MEKSKGTGRPTLIDRDLRPQAMDRVGKPRAECI